MRRNKKHEDFRKLRAKDRRITELRKRKPVFADLPYPIFAGFHRFFKVRDDILRSSIGDVINKIVEHCQHTVFGRTKHPKDFRWCSTLTRLDCTTPEQGLHPIRGDRAEKIFTPHQLRRWFRRETRSYGQGTRVRVVAWYFPEVPRWMLEFGYRKVFFTQVQVIDGPAESEKALIQNHMDRTAGWARLYGKGGKYDDYDTGRRRIIGKVHRREMAETLHEI